AKECKPFSQFAKEKCAAAQSLAACRDGAAASNFPAGLAERELPGQHSVMDQLVVSVRQARPEDAALIAQVYVDSWLDTYAGILPHRLLCSMTPNGQAARWRSAIRARGRESVFVAECGIHGVIGM